MTQKFVVRLMDADARLLAWCEVRASSKPQGHRRSCPFWPDHPTQLVIEQDGTASRLTVHWCDLDLARMQELEPIPVQAGQVYTWTWIGPVWLVPAMEKDVPLPPVTVRGPQQVAVPTGSLTAVGQ